MVRETRLSPNNWYPPCSCWMGKKKKEDIASMPGISRFTTDLALKEMEACLKLGINNFILFPAVAPSLKDKEATYSWSKENFYLKAISAFKEEFPEACLISDVAMDPYSSDGHDGYVDELGRIDNDRTLPILARMALAQAEAGIDILGPSDMMDGRVGFCAGHWTRAAF